MKLLIYIIATPDSVNSPPKEAATSAVRTTLRFSLSIAEIYKAKRTMKDTKEAIIATISNKFSLFFEKSGSRKRLSIANINPTPQIETTTIQRKMLATTYKAYKTM